LFRDFTSKRHFLFLLPEFKLFLSHLQAKLNSEATAGVENVLEGNLPADDFSNSSGAQKTSLLCFFPPHFYSLTMAPPSDIFTRLQRALKTLPKWRVGQAPAAIADINAWAAIVFPLAVRRFTFAHSIFFLSLFLRSLLFLPKGNPEFSSMLPPNNSLIGWDTLLRTSRSQRKRFLLVLPTPPSYLLSLPYFPTSWPTPRRCLEV
jgi:hypothetical protein